MLCPIDAVRKYFASKGLPFNIFLNWTIPLATSNDFNTKAVKMAYLPQNTVSLIETPDQGVIRTFKVCAHGALGKGCQC